MASSSPGEIALIRSRRFLTCALLILLAGFAIRAALYDFFSLDGDDTASLLTSHYDVGTMMDGLFAMRLDIHPPLHFLALKAWTGLAGDSLLALRAMNALIDLLTGAALIRLTSRAFHRPAGLIAGVLWAVAPALIFSTYKIRMYTLLTLFVVLGLWCVVESLRQNGRRRYFWFAGAAASSLAAIYTHSLGMIAFGGLFVALVLVNRKRWRDRLAAAVCFMLAGILALPYLVPLANYYRASGSQVSRQWSDTLFTNPVDIPGTIIAVLALNSLPIAYVLMLALVPLVAVVSFIICRRLGKASVPVLVLFWLSVVALSALAWYVHIYKTFYLSAFAPPLLVLLAIAIWLTPRRLLRGGVLIGAAVLLMGGTIHDLDHAARDDATAATEFVQQHERPGDLVLVVPDWAANEFNYHYRGKLPVVGAFPGVSHDMDLDTLLPFVTKGYSGVWVVRFQPPFADPDGLLDIWFGSHETFVTAVFPSKIPVTYYDLQPQRASLPDYARPLDVQFGDVLALRGVYMPVKEGSARDSRLHPPSNWVQVILYWEVLRAGVNLTPRVRFTDPYGQVYGGSLGSESFLTNRAPVTSWQPGQIWEVTSMLNLNPDTPPGTYNIEVMVFDGASGERLPAHGKDAGEAWALPGQFTIR